jgi:hypothetical protein
MRLLMASAIRKPPSRVAATATGRSSSAARATVTGEALGPVAGHRATAILRRCLYKAWLMDSMIRCLPVRERANISGASMDVMTPTWLAIAGRWLAWVEQSEAKGGDQPN